MKPSILRCIAAVAVFLLVLPVPSGQAQPIPQQLSYQGRVTVQGTNFNGTGRFKFALVLPINQNQTASALSMAGTSVTYISVQNGGSGYLDPPVVTIAAPENPGTTATAEATLTDGVVTGITVTNGGSGYTSQPVVTISPPPPNIQYFTSWSNDQTSISGGEPTAAVSLQVVNGLYSVQLGDVAVGMEVLQPGIFLSAVQLRVWFNDGVHGFQQLTPDQPLGTAPYAFQAIMAQTVPLNSITGDHLAVGAVGSEQLANGAITGAKLASGAIGSGQLAAGAITSTSLADGAVVSNKLASGAVGAASLAPGAAASNLNAGGNQSVTLAAAAFSDSVGIGKTNPQVPLDVVGDVRFLSNHIALGHATATGNPSVAIGDFALASGQGTLAFGNTTSASGLFAVALGNLAEAHGDQSVAMGAGARTYGTGGVAIGDDAISNANYAVAIGFRVRANGGQSSAFGYACETNGASSLAAGYNSITNGYGSVAMGNQNTASGEGSCAVGNSTLAPNKGMLACGNYNPGTDASEIFVVGNGIDANNRARAFWVTTNSDVGVTRDCYAGRNLIYGGAVLQYSDKRLKNPGEPYGAGLEAICQIEPLHFHYKTDNPKHLPSDVERVGVIAQSLRAALPEAVKEDAEGYLSVDKDPVVWALVNSVKQLEAENDSLRHQLETENTVLRKRLDALEGAATPYP